MTNVYVKNVVMNPSLSNVSYNGGIGGIVAQPRPEELAAEREAHVAPTPLQVEHVQAASRDRSLFATTNHGVPLIAATANPGVLKGAGVVPTKAAGTVEPRPPAEEHALPTPQSAPVQGEREEPPPAAPQVEREAAPPVEREGAHPAAPQVEPRSAAWQATTRSAASRSAKRRKREEIAAKFRAAPVIAHRGPFFMLILRYLMRLPGIDGPGNFQAKPPARLVIRIRERSSPAKEKG